MRYSAVAAPAKAAKYKPPATLSQTNPITSTWYTVLETKNALLDFFVVQHTYTEARGMNFRITIDGETIETSGILDVPNGQMHYIFVKHNYLGGKDLLISTDITMVNLFRISARTKCQSRATNNGI
ncbi:unnamed protein product, partial [marine sediment metagenome]